MKWPMFPLDKVADVFGGSTPRRNRSEYWNGDIPWVTPTDLPMPGTEIADVYDTADHITPEGLRSCAANLLPVGTVLYSSRATIGKIGIARVPLATNQGFANFAPKPGVESKYLAYALQYFTVEISSLAGSTTFKEVRRGALKKYKVPLPSPSEQRRIVEILDQADALRKKRAEADAKAARILPALFYKTFGDPATNPKRWPVRALRDVTIGKPQYGANASAAAWSEGKPRYVRITDITDIGRLRKGGTTTLDLDNWEPYRLVPGDLLFARSGNTVGKTYIYRPEDGLCAYAGYLIRFRADTEHVEPWYLFALTQTDYYRNWVESRKRVAGQPNINGKEYASLQIPCPPVPLQQRFTKILEKLIGLREKRFTSTEKIDHLFNVLLYRAFTGDLTAKWREAHMKELLVEMEQQAKALEASIVKKRAPKVKSKRHAGHDMYNKAALAAYITDKCHAEDRPLGRVKVAKLFYLAQRKAELELTEQFALRAAGPVDDDIHKFLSLARKQKWVVLGRAQGDLKPVRPGKDITKGVEQAAKVLGAAKNKVDELLDLIKDWGWRTLERWATVLHAAEEIAASGGQVTVVTIKKSIDEHPEWQAKLDRAEFSDEDLASTLKGLRKFGFIKGR